MRDKTKKRFSVRNISTDEDSQCEGGTATEAMMESTIMLVKGSFPKRGVASFFKYEE